MLKFITNLSCVFNLAVIFMLTSSLPVNDHHMQNIHNTSIKATHNVVNKTNTSQNLDEFIRTLKANYPKLTSFGFDRSFLNGAYIAFLDQCTVKDVSCMAYFDMLVRLADNLTEDSFKLIKKELLENHVSGESFCADFIAALPDAPYSTDTNISMKMKDPTICNVLCLTLNATSYQYNVKPICSITLLGYKHIANAKASINSSISPNLTDTFKSTIKQASSVKSDVASPVVPASNEPQSNTTSSQNIGDANSASNVEVPIENGSSDTKSVTVKHPLSSAQNQFPDGVVSPPVQENVVAPSNNTDVTSDVKPADNKNNENTKVNEVKIDQPVNPKTDTEKKTDNFAPSDEINPNVNAPPVDAAVPSEMTFIPKSKIFDGESINLPQENDMGSEDYTEDEEGPNPNDEVPSLEKSGEIDLIKNNDILGGRDPALQVDGAYGKYTKQEENSEQLDPFTEDTDSNFFTYFMFVMVLCVMLYVVYHNKTKVLALVLEGRRGSHSGRGIGRRKHTAAYRKLDSNLEEAITSNVSGRTTQIIY